MKTEYFISNGRSALLIRTFQSRRNVRFLSRRPIYAFSPAFITAFFASLYTFPFFRRYPFTRESIFLCRRCVRVPRLIRVIIKNILKNKKIIDHMEVIFVWLFYWHQKWQVHTFLVLLLFCFCLWGGVVFQFYRWYIYQYQRFLLVFWHLSVFWVS